MAITGLELNGKVLSIDTDNDGLLLDGVYIAGGINADDRFEAEYVSLDTDAFDGHLDADVDTVQKLAQKMNELVIGIDGSLDTTALTINLKDNIATNLQELAEYVDRMENTVVTDRPVLSCNADIDEGTDAIVTIDNWDADNEYVDIETTSGAVVDNLDGTLSWTVPNVDVDEHHTIHVKAKAEGRGKSDDSAFTVNVVALPVEADDIISFEGSTVTSDTFSVVNGEVTNHLIRATAPDAVATSVEVQQDEQGRTFTNAKPTVWSTAKEFTIEPDGSDDDAVIISEQSISIDQGVLVVPAGSSSVKMLGTTDNVEVITTTGGEAGNNPRELCATDAEEHMQYGRSVAVGDNILVVGAMKEDDPNSDRTRCGCIYIYDLVGGNEIKVSASNSALDAYFGCSVAVCGDTILVGSFRRDVDDVGYAGTMYLYDADGTNERIIRQTEARQSKMAEFNCTLTDTKVIAGAWSETTTEDYSGVVYIWNRDGSNEQRIIPPDVTDRIAFGCYTAAYGTMLIIGCYRHKDNNGAIYVYNTDGEFDKVIKANGATMDFGKSVAINSEYIFVGAPGENDNAGAVYRFALDGSGEMRIAPEDPQEDARFGETLAVQGDKLLVGEPSWNSADKSEQGRGSIYNMEGEYQMHLTVADDEVTRAHAGYSVAINATHVMVGALVGSTDADNSTGVVLMCDSGASSSKYKLDISSLGLNDIPDVVAREVATVETSLSDDGDPAEYEDRTRTRLLYHNDRIMAEYDTDSRIGNEFQIRLSLPHVGDEVSKIRVEIDKA